MAEPSTAPQAAGGEADEAEEAERRARARPDLRGEAERRESDRFSIALLVRDAALGGSFEARQGNLALGGLFFDALHPPSGSRLEVRFILPGGEEEIHARTEVLRVSRDGPRFGTHLRFVEIPLEAELAIARFLQGGGRR